MQVRAQQDQQRPVTVGEIRPGPADEVHPHVPPGPRGWRLCCGQAQLRQCSFPTSRSRSVYMAVECHCRAEYKSEILIMLRRSPVRLGVAAEPAVWVVLPVHPDQVLTPDGGAGPGLPARTSARAAAVEAEESHPIAADLAHQVGQQGLRQPVPVRRVSRSWLTMAASARRSRSLALTGVLIAAPFRCR